MSSKITIRGRVYDLNETPDLVSIQNALVPDNWPIKKSDGVRLFLSLQKMLALEFKRHLAANFKRILKTAVEEGEEGTAEVPVSFSFSVNISAPQVATHGKTKMSYSAKYSTEGKPKTHDLNQGEFLDDDMGVVLDTRGFAKEAEEAGKEKAEQELTGGAPAPGEGPAGGDVNPENTPGDKEEKKKRKK
jgi:hypothetical protein